jgi:GNAT superfamily N-acetyltransferase
VWSIVCFFMAKGFRGKGLMAPFLRAAVAWAAENGAEIVEGYPEDPGGGRLTGYSGYMGLVSAFEKAGFVEVERRAALQPIMRYYIQRTAEDGPEDSRAEVGTEE